MGPKIGDIVKEQNGGTGAIVQIRDDDVTVQWSNGSTETIGGVAFDDSMFLSDTWMIEK